MNRRGYVLLLAICLMQTLGCGTTVHPARAAAAPSPIAVSVPMLTAASVTNFPVQLHASVSYSDGSTNQSGSGLSWSADGAGTVTDSGLFVCTGLGDASVSAHLAKLVATAPTSCLNSPMPQRSGVFIEQSADFAGPFASWLNVKTVYGAAGDGSSDDTAALQRALADQHRQNRVIWLPHGTYNISSTLSLQSCAGLTMIGEDPSTTIIRWVGPQNGTMLDLNGCTRIQVSRITFDGNNTAGTGEHIWWSPSLSTYYPTFNLLSDQTIKNMSVGIRVGFAGEITVERVHFNNNSVAGVSEEDWNALNFSVRDSLFTDCGIGITNRLEGGSGAFNVSNSIFARSRTADMMIGNTGPFSIRRNLSVGSRAFFISTPIGAGAAIVFQANTIVSPTVIPIRIGTPSPVTLIDNRFYGMPSDMPILSGTACCRATDVFSVGNHAPSITPFVGNIGRVKSIDDLFSSSMPEINVSVPTNVYVPPVSTVRVFEVGPHADSSEIQALISQAAKLPGGGVVHLPAGEFRIKGTISIPEGEPVQIIGDGPLATSLVGDAKLTTPILRSESLHLRIAELAIRQKKWNGNPTAEGIQLSVQDVPSTHVLLDGSIVTHLVVDGIDQALIEVLSAGSPSVGMEAPGAELTGGPRLAAGSYGFGRINFFQAGTEWFTLENNARLLEEDFWHDANEPGPAIALNGGAGSVTISGATLLTFVPLPGITVNNFKGSISLTGISAALPLDLGQESGGTALMLAASGVEFADAPIDNATAIGAFGELLNVNVTGNHPVPANDAGNSSAAWIEQMLSPVRTQSPRPRLPISSTAARIRIERVLITSTAAGIHVMPDATSDSITSASSYVLKDRNNIVVSSNSTLDCISEVPENGNDAGWTVSSASDGGIYLESSAQSLSVPNSGGVSNAALAPSSNDAHLEWIVLPVGDGYFRIVNRATGDALTSGGSGSCASLSVPDGSDTQEWSITPASH